MSKRKIALIILCISLSAIIILTSILYTLALASPTFKQTNGFHISEDSAATFSDNVKIAFKDDNIKHNFKEVTLESDGIYTISYSKKLPDFFLNSNVGELFCVYPDNKSKESFFNMGFCGKIVGISAEDNTVTFQIPQIYEIFNSLKVSASDTALQQVSFYPTDIVDSVSSAPLMLNIGNNGAADKTFSIGNTDIDFKYKKNDTDALNSDYQILCKELKIKLKHKADEEFNIRGDITLNYPSLKFLLDYDYNEQKNEVNINDYEFDFVTKEKLNLTFEGKKDIEPLKHSKDLIEKISPVDIVDVTESEKGKYVLGTYLIGYNIKLPDIIPTESLNNTENDVGYLSFGITIQLAVTANGELSAECKYKQSALFEIFADSQHRPNYLLKGYDYPHPIINTAQPDNSREQETPSVSTSYSGKLSFNAGISVDIGFCILGMIPIKLSNGIEIEMLADFDSDESNKEVVIADNSYIESRDIDLFSVNAYSDLKLHMGLKIKGLGKGAEGAVSSDIQIFRKNLFQIPKPIKFDISQCRFGGVQLGDTYDDSQLASAIADYAVKCNDYNIFSYSKDAAINTALSEILSEFGVSTEEFLEDFELSYPECKIDFYSSGAVFVRDINNTVVSIILFKDDFRNDYGLHTELERNEIQALYSVPNESCSIKINIGILLEALLGTEVSNTDLQAIKYTSDDNLAEMEIILMSDKSKLIIIELL